MLALLGPNGAGKTTRLRVCAGLLALKSGSGQILGCDVATHREAIRPLVGYLSAQPMLYPDLSVTENVSFWGRACGAGVDQVGAAVKRLGLDDLADRPVRKLSTGQRRRVSLASVVIRRPRLWLLDEPHAGLDQTGRDVVDGLVQEAVTAGATVIVASHELDRVASIATASITIAGGSVYSPGHAGGGAEGHGPNG